MAVGDTYKLGPGTLSIGATGTEIDVSCLVNNATIAMTKDEGDTTTKLCGDVVPGAVTYTYALGGNTDTDIDDPAGLFALSQASPGTEQDFEFTPNTEAGTSASGKLIIDPLDFGGDTAGETMTSDFEFTIVGKPTYVIGTGGGALTIEGADLRGNKADSKSDTNSGEVQGCGMTDPVKVVGVERLQATLKIAATRILDLSSPAKATAAFLGSRGRAEAPRRTGRLSSSVASSTDGNTAEVSSGLPYANRTHWGYARYRQAAQPWLAEGAHATEDVWITSYEARVDDVLAGVKGVVGAMGDIRLHTPRLRIVREGFDDLEVQTTNSDLVLWDRTRFKHKWPNVGDAPFLWSTFIAWASARRTGAIPTDVSYETFESQALEIETIGDDDEDDERGTPFPEGPGLA